MLTTIYCTNHHAKQMDHVIHMFSQFTSRANLNGGELDCECIGGGFQARVNLNGGQLDKEPFLRKNKINHYELGVKEEKK